jgi:hypothetical protein
MQLCLTWGFHSGEHLYRGLLSYMSSLVGGYQCFRRIYWFTSTPQTAATCYSKTPEFIYQTTWCHYPKATIYIDWQTTNSMTSVHDWTIPSDRRLPAKLVPPFADRECCVVSITDPYGNILDFLDWSHYFFFQVAPQLYSRGWVDPVPDPLLLRKSGIARNQTQDLWICSQELWPLDHRGGHILADNKYNVCNKISIKIHCYFVLSIITSQIVAIKVTK